MRILTPLFKWKTKQKFWGALAEMAEKCDISSGEEEWIRDIFINKMRNYDIQRELLTETLAPQDALRLALVHEQKDMCQLKMTNTTKTQIYYSNCYWSSNTNENKLFM